MAPRDGVMASRDTAGKRPDRSARYETPTLLAVFVALETQAVYILAAFVAGLAARGAPPFLAFAAAAAGGLLVTRAVESFDLPPSVLTAIGGVLSAVGLLAIAALAFTPRGLPPAGFGRGALQPDEPIQLALLIGLWLRAARVAQLNIARAHIVTSFSLGMGLLAIALLFDQGNRGYGAIEAASLPLVACGLIGLALIHQRDAREESGTAARGPWLPITIGAVLGLVIAALLLGVLPLGPLGWLYDHTLAPALTLALYAFVAVMLIVAYPLALLLDRVLTALGQREAGLPPDPGQAAHVSRQLHPTHLNGFAAFGVLLLKVALVVAIVALCASIAYALFGRARRREEEGEEREPIEIEGSLRDDLALLLQGLRPRRGQSTAPTTPDLPPGILAVRRIYLRLLDHAARRGAVRPAAATPNEFEPSLETAVDVSVARAATASFNAARYGLIEPEPEALRRLEEMAREVD